MNQTANVISMAAAEASVRVSQVVYCFDVLRPKTIEHAIPLGVFVDLRVHDQLYGLGLMARSAVSDVELDRVGRLARPIIENPFAYLSGEFDRIIGENDPFAAFSNLPNVHSSALTVSRWVDYRILLPRHLRLSMGLEAPLEEWANDALSGKLGEAFWSLLDEHWPGTSWEKQSRADFKVAA